MTVLARFKADGKMGNVSCSSETSSTGIPRAKEETETIWKDCVS